MITYTEFLKIVEEKIIEYLPEELSDSEVTVFYTEKYLSESYEGISFIPQGSQCGICLNLQDIYEGIDREEEMEMALKMVAEEILEAMAEKPADLDQVTDDLEFFKSHVMIQLISRKNNAEILENIPYTPFGDMAVVYRLIIEQGDGGALTTIVTNSLMAVHDLTVEQLHQIAMENAPRMRPIDIDPLDGKLYLASYDQHKHGAGCMLYPEFPEYAGSIIRSNFFILPFSIHAVLLIRDTGDLSMEFLRDISFKLATFGLDAEERLTKEVYYCDIMKRTIVKAEGYVH